MAIPNLKKRIREMNGGRSLDQQTASGNVQQTASASNANQDVFNKDSTQAASKAGRSSRRAVLKTTHDLDYLLSEFPREDSLDDLLQED